MRPTEIGAILRRTRDEKAVSLEQAEAETKIRRKYLEALEEGRARDIPGEVYFKGFLRSYANFLGLDGTALVEAYKQEVGDPGDSAAAQEPAAERDDGDPTPRIQPVIKPAAGKSRVPWLPLLVILLLGGALAVWFLALQGPVPGAATTGSGAPSAETPPAAEPPAASAPPAAGPEQAPAPPAPAPEAPAPAVPEPPLVVAGAPAADGTRQFTVSPGPIQVDLAFRAASWVRVSRDGQVVAAAGETVPAGERRRYTAERELRIRIGWTEVVDVTINGHDFGAAASERNRELVIRAAGS